MPFTLVHPLAVVPLRRLGIFSALIIGSMVPDFARLASPFGEPHGHTWTAALLYYLPIAIVTLCVFHRLIKLPMISLAPRRIQPWLLAQSPEFSFFPLSRLALIVASALAGIATHLFWDSFTHNGGWALGWLHLDATRIDFSAHRSIYVADILQDLSSIGGMLLVIYLLSRILSRHSIPADARKAQLAVMPVLGLHKFALMAAGVFLAMVPACVMFARDPQYWLHNERRQFVGFTAISVMDVVFLEILVFSIMWHVRYRESRRTGLADPIE